MKDEELIGKKFYGFKFPNGYAGIAFVECMNDFTGHIGEIIYANLTGVTIEFPSGRIWTYPKELVIEQLGTRSAEPEIFKIL